MRNRDLSLPKRDNTHKDNVFRADSSELSLRTCHVCRCFVMLLAWQDVDGDIFDNHV